MLSSVDHEQMFHNLWLSNVEMFKTADRVPAKIAFFMIDMHYSKLPTDWYPF